MRENKRAEIDLWKHDAINWESLGGRSQREPQTPAVTTPSVSRKTLAHRRRFELLPPNS